MNFFRQICYEMKHQKMMTWVSISGTALSIFLVMALFMSDQVKSVEISPETNRHRILSAENLHVKGTRINGSTTGLNKDMIDKLYADLDGIEKVSYKYAFPWGMRINVRGQNPMGVTPLKVDNEFWNIFDFKFIDGKPFDKADANDNAKKVVISRTTARKLFGEDNVAGREVQINWINYTVCGVVEDVNPIFRSSFANIYLPYHPGVSDNPYFGNENMILLMKDGVKPEYIKEQVEKRYKAINAEIAPEGDEIIYHLQPYTCQEVSLGNYGSNNAPDMKGHNKKIWIFYTILVLLPAINLSSMTRSRLRHRVTEIGVRRAFGAKRISIIWQIFAENLIITIIGGIIGLILSIVLISLASHLFFVNGNFLTTSLEIINARPSFAMLFQWHNFIIALLFCLILNILSVTVPAWKASRVEPAAAIAKSR